MKKGFLKGWFIFDGVLLIVLMIAMKQGFLPLCVAMACAALIYLMSKPRVFEDESARTEIDMDVIDEAKRKTPDLCIPADRAGFRRLHAQLEKDQRANTFNNSSESNNGTTTAQYFHS